LLQWDCCQLELLLKCVLRSGLQSIPYGSTVQGIEMRKYFKILIIGSLFFLCLLWSLRDPASSTGRLLAVASCGSITYLLILGGMVWTVQAAERTATINRRIWAWAIFLSLAVSNIVAWGVMARIVSH
jgi:hypothetical protein